MGGKTFWTWFGLTALAAIGCSAEVHTGATRPKDRASNVAREQRTEPMAESEPAAGEAAARQDPPPARDLVDALPSRSTSSFATLTDSTCAITANHTVRCWGNNDYGQIGDGTRTHRNEATEVSQLDEVQQLDVGDNNVCAVRSDGSLYCWGNNGNGNLHIEWPPEQLSRPTRVEGLTTALQVSMGVYQVCVRHTDDTLECWRKTDDSASGADGAADVIDVEVGYGRTTAWFRDGSVRTWGRAVPSGPDEARVERVVSGRQHACVLLDDGGVYCYGAATDLRGMTDAIGLAAGSEHSCALLRDHTVRCWGHNERGQLGDGSNDDASVPVEVRGLSHVSEIQCGRQHTCARHEDGSISCWGSNEFGQLGDGTSDHSNTPVRVLGL